MLRRLLPHPALSLTLVIVWLGLVNKITPGNILLGAILGLVVPAITGPYWPNRPVLRRPLKVVEYIFVVLWDIVVANFQVAWIVMFRPNAQIRSAWVRVPLDLTSAEAITALAGTITLTPGTVTAMLSAYARALLVHTLHTDDPDGVRDDIKARYESRLKEIFE